MEENQFQLLEPLPKDNYLSSSISSLKKSPKTQYPMQYSKRGNNETIQADYRTVVLSLCKKHEDKRKEAKLREAMERKKVLEVWKKNENIQKEKHLNELFNRLSFPKKPNDSVHYKALLEKIETRFKTSQNKVQEKFKSQRYSEQPSSKQKEKREKILNQFKEDIEKKKKYFEEKEERANKNLHRLKKSRSQTAQLNKERREKKTFRAKIQGILYNETGGICENYNKKFQRYYQIERLKGNFTSEKIGPDEALINHFNGEELRRIRDDINFFVTDKNCRQKITLFTLPVGNSTKYLENKFKDIAAQGEFNLTSVEQFMKMRDGKPFVPTRSREYLKWRKSTQQPRKSEETESRMRISPELTRARIEDNFYRSQQRFQNSQSQLSERVSTRQQLATSIAEARRNETKNIAAATNRKQSAFIEKMIKQKAEERASRDIIQGCLYEIQDNYTQEKIRRRALSNEVKKKLLKLNYQTIKKLVLQDPPITVIYN